MTDSELVQHLIQRLRIAVSASPSTEVAADQIAGLYQEAADMIDALRSLQAECKEALGEIMVETGNTTIDTSTARVTISKPYTRVSYDTKGIEAKAKKNAAFAFAIAEFRKSTHVAGSMSIRKANQR